MAKGGASENETCRELSKWWSYGESRAMFARTQMSGGKATIRSRKKKSTPYEYGDITFSDPRGQPLIDFFLLENKSGYKDTINILDFIDSPNKHPQLLKWWVKAEQEKELAGRYFSLLIFRRTRKSKCVMMTSELFNLCESFSGDWNQSKPILDVAIEKYYWIVISFNNFLDWVSPDSIIAIKNHKDKGEE